MDEVCGVTLHLDRLLLQCLAQDSLQLLILLCHALQCRQRPEVGLLLRLLSFNLRILDELLAIELDTDSTPARSALLILSCRCQRVELTISRNLTTSSQWRFGGLSPIRVRRLLNRGATVQLLSTSLSLEMIVKFLL